MNERMFEIEQEAQERYKEIAINRAREFKIVEGAPGVCEYCGFYVKRLVKQACAPCRDELKLGW